MFKTILAAAVMAGGVILGGMAQAAPITFDFYRISNNSTVDASSQLQVIANETTGGAILEFRVLAGAQSGATIKEIYFDAAGVIVPPLEIIEQVGVSYVVGSASPGELPGANNATPDFETTAMLLADQAGNNATGIQINDLLKLKLNFAGGVDWAGFIAAALDGSFRIGLHVGSLNNGASDGFVSNPPPIPLPAGGLLLLTALAGAGVVARRRKTA